MSEINAIATNNFILHNIDAKKLYVQEPLFTANSGDAVYVGWRPDETVLWSGTFSGSVTSTNYISLSEAPSAFERVIITNGGGYKSCYEYAGTSNTWSYMQTFAADGNTTVYANRYDVDQANKKVICLASNSFGVNSNGINNWAKRNSMNVGETQLTKVVGINRKENV